MDPITWVYIIGLAASLASSGYSAYSSRQAAKQTEYNAEHAARAEKLKAEEEAARAKAQERLDRREARRRRASIEAKFAASGLLMSGTPAFVLEEQAKADELSFREGNRVQQTGFMRSMEQASYLRSSGQAEAAAHQNQATGTLISGLGHATSSIVLANQAGVFGENGLFKKG
jgi:uncharacterized membrane protein YqiK